MAVVAAEEAALTATGWLAVSGTEGRYWTHPARYGDAYFDRHEVAAIENGNGLRRPKPRRSGLPLPVALRPASGGHLLEVRQACVLTRC